MSIETRVNEKGKKYYVARIYVGGGESRSKSFSKRSDAIAYETQYKNFKTNNTYDKTISDKTLFSVVLKKFIERTTETRKDRTTIAYKSKINKWIEPQLGMFQIGNITSVTIPRFVINLENEGATPKTIRYCLLVLNQILIFASTGLEKYISYNPMSEWQFSEIEHVSSTALKYWQKDQVKKFLSNAQGDHFYLVFVIMLNTGLRISEAMALTKDDFDFEAKSINVSKQLSLYVPKRNEPKYETQMIIVSSLKNRVNRAVPMNKAVEQAGRLLIEKTNDNYFLVQSPTKQKATVMLKRGAKPLLIEASIGNEKTILNHISAIATASGLKSTGAHILRHSFAANFMMNGGDLYDLSTLLGHTSITSTQIYAHLSKKYLMKAISIVSFEG